MAGRQKSRQKARQTGRHMYRKTKHRKIKNRKTDVQTYMQFFWADIHRDTQTYRWTDKHEDQQTVTVHRGRQPDSSQTGK